MRNAAQLATSALLASGATAQVVQWDIEKRVDTAAPRLRRRAGTTVDEQITNDLTHGGYFASCTVGTPAQKVTLQLDTGSSDIWVPASTSSICQKSTSQGGGCTLGSYDPDKSSSIEVLTDNFKISYVDGSYSKGDYVSETFGIGNVNVQNVTMGVGLDTDIAYGLVGVGYAYNEASVSQSAQIYNNLPLVLRNDNQTRTAAYSLWLNDLDASKGSILFGGIDTDKYMGDLIRVDVQKDAKAEQYTAFTVMLTSMLAHSTSGEDTLSSSSFPIPAVLDSGTTLSYLPQDLAEQIWQEVGATYVAGDQQGSGAPVVPCALANTQNYFTFGFGGKGGPAINVSMSELILPGASGTYDSGPFKGQNACQFGIQNTTDDSSFLLGDTFLRSAYVVYDLENNEIALAPTDFNATSTNVVPFASQAATIPSSTPAPSQNALVSGSTTQPKYAAQSGFTKLGGSSSSGSGSGSNSGSGSSGSGNGNAASLTPALDLTQMLVMGASMGLMMVGGGAFLLF